MVIPTNYPELSFETGGGFLKYAIFKMSRGLIKFEKEEIW